MQHDGTYCSSLVCRCTLSHHLALLIIIEPYREFPDTSCSSRLQIPHRHNSHNTLLVKPLSVTNSCLRNLLMEPKSSYKNCTLSFHTYRQANTSSIPCLAIPFFLSSDEMLVKLISLSKNVPRCLFQTLNWFCSVSCRVNDRCQIGSGETGKLTNTIGHFKWVAGIWLAGRMPQY